MGKVGGNRKISASERGEMELAGEMEFLPFIPHFCGGKSMLC